MIPGVFHAFPVICSYFWAAQGDKDKALLCIDTAFAVCDEYCTLMTTASELNNGKPKSDTFMLDSYRSCVGWFGVFLLCANCIMKLQFQEIPFDRVSEETGAYVMASLSLVGLKGFEWGFLKDDRDPNFTRLELRQWLHDTLVEEMNNILKRFAENSDQ